MADEGIVQVSIDGTGKKVRNLVIAKPVLDGVPDANADQNRYIQVVALTDVNGRIVSIDMGVLTEMLAAQQETNNLLLEILARL